MDSDTASEIQRGRYGPLLPNARQLTALGEAVTREPIGGTLKLTARYRHLYYHSAGFQKSCDAFALAVAYILASKEK